MSLLAAAQFLTRIPIRLRHEPDVARAAAWFPIVGVAIGAGVGGVAAGLMEILPATVAAAVAVLVGVLLTGAFHEDGLADSADALGGWTPEQRREILKDSRLGSYGVVAMCGSIVLRIVCLATLGPATAFAGSVAAHGLGRAGAVAAMTTAPSSGVDGLGAAYVRSIRRPAAVAGVLGAVALCAVAVGWWVAPLVGAVAIGTVAVVVLARRAFGGLSGDVLGAVEQVGECLVLVVVSGLAMHHAVWWA